MGFRKKKKSRGLWEKTKGETAFSNENKKKKKVLETLAIRHTVKKKKNQQKKQASRHRK